MQHAPTVPGAFDAHAEVLLERQRHLQGVEAVHLDTALLTEQRLGIIDTLPVDVVLLVAFADQQLLERLLQFGVVHCVSFIRLRNRNSASAPTIAANSNSRAQ